MCDTMVAMRDATRDGVVIFAKNSDRNPNEPHLMIRVPRASHPKGSKVRCTYMEIGQAEETNEVLLLKPSWIWGAEMGCNGHGLAIGNEALHTKEPCADTGLTGMDMLRIALERCRTSEEALDLLVKLLGEYGQGGNCGYQRRFTYHNAFLMADSRSAWVLETAGPYWAAEKVRGARCISNAISIGARFDRCHPDLIRHAVDSGWCRGERDFDFARCYSDRRLTRRQRGRERFALCSSRLKQDEGSITVETMMRTLRLHQDGLVNPFSQAARESICMHAGALRGGHTTGSFVAELTPGRFTSWITGSSTPCISVFKPWWMTRGEPLTFSQDRTDDAVAYWMERERLHRMVIENRIPNLPRLLAARDSMENDFRDRAAALGGDCAEELLDELMASACENESRWVREVLESGLGAAPAISGGRYFRKYWTAQN